MRRTALIAWTAVAFSLNTLGAQDSARVTEPSPRAGIWVGGAAGYGSAKLSCSGCSSISSRGSQTLYFRIGATLNPRTLLGVEANTWTKNEGGAADWIAALSLAVYHYPIANTGLQLKIGAGYSKFHETSAQYYGAVGHSGFGGIAGVGYDLRISPTVFLAPAMTLTYGRIDVSQGGGFSQYVIDIALNVLAFFPPHRSRGE